VILIKKELQRGDEDFNKERKSLFKSLTKKLKGIEQFKTENLKQEDSSDNESDM